MPHSVTPGEFTKSNCRKVVFYNNFIHFVIYTRGFGIFSVPAIFGLFYWNVHKSEDFGKQWASSTKLYQLHEFSDIFTVCQTFET